MSIENNRCPKELCIEQYFGVQFNENYNPNADFGGLADLLQSYEQHIQSSPSEFGLVKKEDYDRVVNGLKNAGAASLKLYTKAKDNADQLAEALENITYSPVPYNQREKEIWMDTARRTAQTALTNCEQSNP